MGFLTSRSGREIKEEADEGAGKRKDWERAGGGDINQNKGKQRARLLNMYFSIFIWMSVDASAVLLGSSWVSLMGPLH